MMKKLAAAALLLCACVGCDSATAASGASAEGAVVARDERFSNGVTVKVADTLTATAMSTPLTCLVPVQFLNVNPSTVTLSAVTATGTAGAATRTHTFTAAQVQAAWPALPTFAWTTRNLTVGSPGSATAFNAAILVRWNSGFIPGQVDSVTVTTHCKP